MYMVFSLNTHRIQAEYSCNLHQKRTQFRLNYTTIQPELQGRKGHFLRKESINA